MGSEDRSAEIPAATIAPGSVIGNYLVERELGRGGMGAVYAAVDQTLGKRVALKVLLPAVSQRDDLVQRFFNEARAASTIRHPGIVEVFHYGGGAGNAYIVMEYLEGVSLAARLKSHGLLSIPSAIAIARQTALALSAAHRAGIVHRDLKPDNMFLVPDPEVSGGERVKLLDFGVAKLVDQPSSQPVQTVTGAILGTPQYMSPEQCEGARVVDHRTDLYSLGCTLFQMVTGRLPFVAAGMGGMIGAHLYEAPPHARDHNPLVSDALDAIIDRLLAKSPDARFGSGDEVATALSDPATGVVTRPQPIPETPVARIDVEPGVTRATHADPSTYRSQNRVVRRRWWIPVLGLLVAGAAGAAVFFAMRMEVDVQIDDPATSRAGGDKAADLKPASPPARPDPKPAPAKPDLKPDELADPSKPDQAELAHATLTLLRGEVASPNPDLQLAGQYLVAIDRSNDVAARAEAAKIRAQFHPIKVARVLPSLTKLRDQGKCAEAKTAVQNVVRAWGADSALDKAIAGCRSDFGNFDDAAKPTTDQGTPINTTVTPPKPAVVKDPVVDEIRREYAAQRYQITMAICVKSGLGVRVPPYECMIAACRSDNIEAAAVIVLRSAGQGFEVNRGLNDCKPYDVAGWLNKDGNRQRLESKMVPPKQQQKLQEQRRQRLQNRGAPPPGDDTFRN